MNTKLLENLLVSVADGTTAPNEALSRLRSLPFEDLGMARPDFHRSLRQGTSEAIFCQGKTPEQVVEITRALLQANNSALATRCNTSQYEALKKSFPETKYNAQARIASIQLVDNPQTDVGHSHTVACHSSTDSNSSRTNVNSSLLPAHNDERAPLLTVVVSAGTADIPVAEESAAVLDHFGFRVTRIFDVGVAGLHRLLFHVKELQAADAIIVVAGMDGALSSVVGGLVSCPVIAVPTSVGYGASFEGLAALLTMLNSCAHGITVVNIDNGFGAAMAAVRNLLKRNAG